MHRFLRFRYLTAVIVALALLSAFLVAASLAWRSVNDSMQMSAHRAVFNADRLLDRTVNELNKIDQLRKLPCDASTVRSLQETVYGSLSQIREVGLIRDGRLYCTNFGPTDKEQPIASRLTNPGVHVDVSPNSVVPNNTSLYVYVSRDKDSAVNALFNPEVLAEFERDFEFSGMGTLSLRLASSAGQQENQDVVRTTVYNVGSLRSQDSAGWLLRYSEASARSAFVASTEVSSRAWWGETLATFPFALLVAALAAAAVLWLVRRWLANGNLDRLRYLAALERDEFVMHYQPIIEAATRNIVGMEALLRWQHPRRGLLRAAQFADIFSHDTIAPTLAHRVLALVERDLAMIPETIPGWCTVNIAPTLLEDNAVLTELTTRIAKMGSKRVRLEITERAPIGDYAEVMLHEVRANGFKIGMDDLGTGYANLSQLQRMPFDFIKIDGMLVRGIQSHDSVSPVVLSLIKMARDLNAEVVVEGVETRMQADALSAAGATHLQGFFFDAARPMSELIAILKQKQIEPRPA